MTVPASNRLAAFLYEMMRNGCPLDVMEGIVQKEEEAGQDMQFFLTDHHLAAHAEKVAYRLAMVWSGKAPLMKVFCSQCEGEDDDSNACLSHCCKTHGCKYGDEDCVVATGQKEQESECMKGAWCGEPGLFDDDEDGDDDVHTD